jgi:hypothetical protein
MQSVEKGKVSEWLMVQSWNDCACESMPRVRIPPFPFILRVKFCKEVRVLPTYRRCVCVSNEFTLRGKRNEL